MKSASNAKIPFVRLGDYIERSKKNNSKLEYGEEFIEGVNSKGEFCKTKAGLIDINLKPYKLVNNGDFVYNPSRFNIGSIGYRTQGFCIVSHLYVIFHLTEYGKQLKLFEEIIYSDKSNKDKEREIDLLVYHLYDLTYGEVKIVDPETDITEEEYNNI